MGTPTAHGYGKAEIPPGAVNLHAYAGLTYAPFQHGEGIRFAHNGKPVEETLKVAPGTVADIDQMAAALGVSFGDVCDALKYLRDNGKI